MKTIKAYITLKTKPKFNLTFKGRNWNGRILDIGLANFSYKEMKMIYPNCIYTGVDIVEPKHNFSKNDCFKLLNLECEDNVQQLIEKYDLIIINHVLEHLVNGEYIINHLCKLLNTNGIMYIEYPSIKTAYRKKTRHRYHFHDDKTHKRFYELSHLGNIAIQNECEIISCGPTSTMLKNLISIPRAIYALITGRPMGPYLLHMQKKIDHLLIRKKPNNLMLCTNNDQM